MAILFAPPAWNAIRSFIPTRGASAIRAVLSIVVMAVVLIPYLSDQLIGQDGAATRGDNPAGPPPTPEEIKRNADPTTGRYYALLLAAQNYEEFNKLQNPIDDARKLREVLVKKYLFKESDVVLIENPTRTMMIDSLDSFSLKMSANDNLIVFYAGHGKLRTLGNEGCWIPVDGKRHSSANYVSSGEILKRFQGIKARHVLLLIDACFSGSIFEEMTATRAEDNAANKYGRHSRKAMTSGALEEVSDKSLFMKLLIDELSSNRSPFLTASSLFHAVQDSLENVTGYTQVPQFQNLQTDLNEGGDFIFVRRPE